MKVLFLEKVAYIPKRLLKSRKKFGGIDLKLSFG